MVLKKLEEALKGCNIHPEVYRELSKTAVSFDKVFYDIYQSMQEIMDRRHELEDRFFRDLRKIDPMSKSDKADLKYAFDTINEHYEHQLMELDEQKEKAEKLSSEFIEEVQNLLAA